MFEVESPTESSFRYRLKHLIITGKNVKAVLEYGTHENVKMGPWAI